MFKNSFIQLILVQIRDFYREPAALFWSLLFPVLMAWGLGIAFSKKPEQTKTIALVLNEYQNTNSFERYITKSTFIKKTDSISGKSFFYINYGNEQVGITHYIIKPVNSQQAELMIKRGNAALFLSINDSTLEYHFDRYNSDAQLSYLQLSSLFKGEVQLSQQSEVMPMIEKGTRYVDFLIPGLIAMNVMMSVMWGISYTLIENRTKKLLRRMVATPMPKWEYIASHIVARIILCFIEAIIIFSFSYYYFNITIEGSILAFIILFLSGIIAFSGIAVLIASRTAKTQVGNGLINLIVMPMMLLSGIYFSYHNFPDKVIPLIQALPLTMLADGVRAIFNESAGIIQIWKYILILNALGLITFTIGLKTFKWY
mgnify:CR=1 FL=1